MARMYRSSDLEKDLAEAGQDYWMAATIKLFIGFMVSAAFFPPLLILWAIWVAVVCVGWGAKKQEVRLWHADRQAEAARKRQPKFRW